MASPRISRFTRQAEQELEAKTTKFGLSDYTAQRLAELRARRAAQEEDMGLSPRKDSLTNVTEAPESREQRPSQQEDKDGTPRQGSLNNFSVTDGSTESRVRHVEDDAKKETSLITCGVYTPSIAVEMNSQPKKMQETLSVTNGGKLEDIKTVKSEPRTPAKVPVKKPWQRDDDDRFKKTVSINNVEEIQIGNKMSNWPNYIPTNGQTNGCVSNGSHDLTKEYKEYPAEYGSRGDMNGGKVKRTDSRSTIDNMDDEDSIGFASLPEQVHRKALKRGFDFTLMIVGESGLGKSTIVQSLFLNTDLYRERTFPKVLECVNKTVEIEKRYMEIEEKGVKLRLTIVDTPGYNDSLSGDDSWRPVEMYIDQQFEQYYRDESGLNRKNIKDNRVHCCLYFISPYGHGLKPIDIHFMKRLHNKVNIMPVIAKADTLTKQEVVTLKQRVLEQIHNNGIHIYEFPDCDEDEDVEFKIQDQLLKAAVPFAVVGSNTIVDVAGKKIRGRLYPWGIVEVDNPEHCDFIKLRQMLISTHMQDLKDVTRDVHYENYRARFINEQMSKTTRERNKLKRDSSPNFEAIMTTDALLEEKDAEIKKMQQMLLQMQKQLHSTNAPTIAPIVQSGLHNL